MSAEHVAKPAFLRMQFGASLANDNIDDPFRNRKVASFELCGTRPRGMPGTCNVHAETQIADRFDMWSREDEQEDFLTWTFTRDTLLVELFNVVLWKKLYISP